MQSQCPKYLWNEAVYTSVFLINSSPTRVLQYKKTPAEMWFGEKPNFEKIKIFGCNAYAWIANQKRQKSRIDNSGGIVQTGIVYGIQIRPKL